MWYTFLGAFQWSVWEVIFMRLWATGALPYISDASAFADPATAAKVLFWVAAVPVFREFHFYWAHRMLHFRVLYRFVHSLHHRNVRPCPSRPLRSPAPPLPLHLRLLHTCLHCVAENRASLLPLRGACRWIRSRSPGSACTPSNTCTTWPRSCRLLC